MPPNRAERKAHLTRDAEAPIDRVMIEEKPANGIVFENIKQASHELYAPIEMRSAEAL